MRQTSRMASTPRIFSPHALALGPCTLGSQNAGNAVRHLQVLRLDAGAAITLFDGRGGEWQAQVVQTRKHEVALDITAHLAIEREARVPVHLALGMPANDRMDFLVEKATELGVASIQPLVTSRSVLRLSGERAAKKTAHWQAIAVAACEQCGRNRVPPIHPVATLDAWLASQAGHAAPSSQSAAPLTSLRWLLGFDPDAWAVSAARVQPGDAQPAALAVTVLSGPEGGLTAEECAEAKRQRFVTVSLGPRILRADTAPLAALALLSEA